MKKIISKKVVLFILGLILCSILGTYICVTFNSDFVTKRADPESTVSISNNYKIQQKLILSDKTTDIYVSVCLNAEPNELDSTQKIVFELNQNNISSYYEYKLNELEHTGWKDIRLRNIYSKLKSGECELSIYGSNIQDGLVSVMITGGEQQSIEFNNVSINNEELNGQFLSIECRSIDLNGLIVKFFKIMLIFLLLILFVKIILMILKSYPITGLALIVITIFLLRYNFMLSYEVDDWVKTTWMSDYRYGFINRGFAASILSLGLLIFKGSTYITGTFLHSFLVITTLVGLLISVLFVYLIEKEAKRKEYNVVFLYFWITSPWFTTFFITSGTLMGRLDILLMICYLMSLLCLIKQKRLWLVPIITTIGILIYPIYTIMYFPVIFLFLLEKAIVEKSLMTKINVLVTTFVTIVLTVYFYVGGTLVGKVSMQEYYLQQTGRTDMTINTDVMLVYPFHLEIGRTDISQNHLLLRLGMLLLFSMLSIIFISKFWVRLYKKTYKNMEKIIYIGYLMAPWSLILLFRYSDLMKFMVGIYTAFITAPLVMTITKGKDVDKVVREIDQEFQNQLGKNYLIIHAIVFSLLGITYGTAWPFSDVTTNIIEFIGKI